MSRDKKHRFAELFAGEVRAIAAFEGKRIEVIDEDLGVGSGRGAAAIERYRNGRAMPNDPLVVRYLAEAGVRRAMLGREWLRQFLDAAGYPFPDHLIKELGMDQQAPGVAPAPAPAPASPWRDNLDAPPYSQFVARQEILAALLRGLSGAPVVVLLSMGGMGKTSLAYYVADLCRARHAARDGGSGARLPGDLPAVEAAVWVSDMDNPGATTLGRLLDSIARTLDHPGLTTLDPAQKQAEVLALLQRHPTLLVIDNAETIRDQALLRLLPRLPRGTRVLVTTRQMSEAYAHDAVRLVPLGGMSGPEARNLIKAQAAQIGYLHTRDPQAQEALIQRTGGCPQALKQIVGYAKRTGQTLGDIAARVDALTGDLLADLFERIWGETLDGPARQLLITLALFHQSVARSALGSVAAFSPATLSAAIGQLTDVALIEEQSGPHAAHEPRFGLHPLTREFVAARQHEFAAFRDDARERMITWAAEYAEAYGGYILDDLPRLSRLDADAASLMAALEEAGRSGRHSAAISLARGLEFYYYVGCRWEEKLRLHQHYIAAAAALGDSAEQINALTMHIQLLCRLNRADEAADVLRQLEPLADTAAGQARFHLLHARGLYHYTRREQLLAQAAWAEILEHAEAWGLPEHMRVGALHWLGLSNQRQGDPAFARALFERSLALARREGIDRWVARNLLQLALISIRAGEPRRAAPQLEEARALTGENDREQRAHLWRVEAWLHDALRQPLEAQRAYREARDLFARMGLLHELAEEEARFGARDLGSNEPGSGRRG